MIGSTTTRVLEARGAAPRDPWTPWSPFDAPPAVYEPQAQPELSQPELSIVMPCLNEADTLGTCIEKAQRALADARIDGEIVIADNGSTDGSKEIAESMGARVVEVGERGYGNALKGGIAASRGRFVLMGDCDDSYDFGEVPRFVQKLRDGAELVQGCRLPSGGGTVRPGAMPLLHRWWGNPGFSLMARWWFAAPIHDVYCGMRGFTRALYDRLELRSPGMEFATEMIIKASRYNARIAEVPITLHPDGRKSHPPHLKTFRDGWRTLRFYLMHSPRWLFLEPGKLLVLLGVIGYMLALPGAHIGPVEFGLHTLMLASLAILCGQQAILFAIGTKVVAISSRQCPPDARVERFFRVCTLERGLILGAAALTLGLGMIVAIANVWRLEHFGNLASEVTLRWIIPGATLTAAGLQTMLSSFFISIIGTLSNGLTDKRKAAPAQPTFRPKHGRKREDKNGIETPAVEVEQPAAELSAIAPAKPRELSAIEPESHVKVKFAEVPPEPEVTEPVVTKPAHPVYRHLICTAIALALFLVAPRAATVGYDWYAFSSPFEQLPAVFITAVYDVFTVAVLALATAGVMWLLRKKPRGQLATMFSFDGLAVLMLLMGVANVEIVKMLGGPFNYRWLYYSDFFKSRDGHHAMFASVTLSSIFGVVSLCGAMLLLAFAIRWSISRIEKKLPTKYIAIALTPAVMLYLFFGHWYLTTQKWNDNKLCNPLVAFVGSMLGSYDAPALLTMRTQFTPDDVMTVRDRATKGAQDAGRYATGSGRTATGVKNVILFVMESVPAEYLEVYGGKYPITPTLTKYRDRSILFRDVYAHAPATNMSLVSILCSSYPWVSYMTLTQEHPDVPLTSLPAALKGVGDYRTAYFASGDLVYQGAGNFLAHRQFDLVEDFQTRLKNSAEAAKSATMFKSDKWSFLNGTDDLSTAGAMIDWIGKGDPNTPFFACMWTLTTHYPYYVSPAENTDYKVGEPTLNRYLNALKHGDAALGHVLEDLEKRNLLDSTLVVVVGDHGEAFGRHDQWGHGTHLYEENLKVPAILINPKLFKGEERNVVGGVVDIAPTILDVLGQKKLPADWQGHSLLASDRFDRVYFCAPWSDFLFGYRDGDKKLIYNATKNEFEVYDLKNDPMETWNMSAQETAFVHSGQQRMAAWVQYQHRFYNGLFKAKPLTAATQQPTTKPTASAW